MNKKLYNTSSQIHTPEYECPKDYSTITLNVYYHGKLKNFAGAREQENPNSLYILRLNYHLTSRLYLPKVGYCGQCQIQYIDVRPRQINGKCLSHVLEQNQRGAYTINVVEMSCNPIKSFIDGPYPFKINFSIDRNCIAYTFRPNKNCKFSNIFYIIISGNE